MSKLKITVIIENNAINPSLKTEHGLAFWIEFSGKNYIFDTGATDAFAENLKLLGFDAKNAEAIILSHGHYDHTGGLASAIKQGFDGKIYIHPEGLKQKYSISRSYVREISIPKNSKETLLDFQHRGKIVYVDYPLYADDNFFITGKIPRPFGNPKTNDVFFLDLQCRVPDKLNDDMAIAINTSKGLVIVCGCAHSGLQNTIDYIQTLSQIKQIYAVLGGTHIKAKDPAELGEITDYLNQLGISIIAPNHCTCKEAIEFFKAHFKGQTIDFPAGSVFEAD